MIVSNILILLESYQICLVGLQTMYYPHVIEKDFSVWN